MQTDSPEKLTLLGVLPCYDNTEAMYHRDFRAYKVHGEWFEAAPELLAHIAKEAKPHQRCDECPHYDSQTDGRLVVLQRTPTHRKQASLEIADDLRDPERSQFIADLQELSKRVACPCRECR